MLKKAVKLQNKLKGQRSAERSFLVRGVGPIVFRPGETFLEACLRSNLQIHHSCGGHGTCTTCIARIESAADLPVRNELEQERAEERSFHVKERLCCQVLAQEESELVFSYDPSPT